MSAFFNAPDQEDARLLQEQIPTRQEMMDYLMHEIWEYLFQYTIFENLTEEQSRAYILMGLAASGRKEQSHDG